MAARAVASGAADCTLAVGFDRMYKGELKRIFTDERAFPTQKFHDRNIELRGSDTSPWAVKIFADAGREHMERYGTTLDQITKIAVKNHRHSANNKNSMLRKPFTLEEIKNSPMIHSPV